MAVSAVATWWLLGYLPWLLMGLTSNVAPVGPEAPGLGTDGLVTAVPMVAQHTVLLLVCASLGGLVAVLVSAVTGRSWPLALTVALGVLAAGYLLGSWSAARVRDAAAGEFAADDRVLGGLQALHLAAVAAGVVTGLLLLVAPPALRLVLGAAPAALLVSWLGSVWLVLDGGVVGEPSTVAARWLPGVVVGLLLGLLAADCLRRPLDLWAVPPALAIGLAVEGTLPVLVLVQDRLRPGSGLDEDGAAALAALLGDGLRTIVPSPDAHLWWMWGLAAAVAGILVALGRLRGGATRSS